MSLVKRAQKVAFYEVMENGVATYHRMSKFTDITTEKNPIEYSRQYIDEEFKQTAVVGYSTEISYSFDMHSENPVHLDIAEIHDKEITGTDAVRSIIVVDLSKEVDGGYKARKRSFSVIPNKEGDSTDAYTYSGSFSACGEIIEGVATSSDNFATISFN